jgi:hypothetical protein
LLSIKANEELLRGIKWVRNQAIEKVRVDAAPTFFINGRKCTDDTSIKELAIGGELAEESSRAHASLRKLVANRTASPFRLLWPMGGLARRKQLEAVSPVGSASFKMRLDISN